MSVETHQTTAHTWFSQPPSWLLPGLSLLYVSGIALLVLWPGSTLLDRLRAIDGGICAQLPSHTLYPGGTRLPLCSRNTGIYLGVTLGAGYLFYRGRGTSIEIPTGIVKYILFSGVVLMAVDGFNSLFLDIGLPHLYQPNNMLRLATGLLTGIAIAAFLLPVTNSVIWREYDERPSFAAVTQLVPLIPVLAIAFLTVASQSAWILYPVAILSTIGVIGTLLCINLTLMVALSGRIGQYSTLKQSFPIITLALGAALSELMILFYANHFLLQKLAA